LCCDKRFKDSVVFIAGYELVRTHCRPVAVIDNLHDKYPGKNQPPGIVNSHIRITEESEKWRQHNNKTAKPTVDAEEVFVIKLLPAELFQQIYRIVPECKYIYKPVQNKIHIGFSFLFYIAGILPTFLTAILNRCMPINA
jgi:hypothetical protein